MHPKIQQLMGAFMKQQDGKVGLKRLLESEGKTLSDLPKIPGASIVCYNFIMGK